MPGKMKLTYFGIRGLAENARLMLEDNAVEYEDHRLGDNEWAELKPKMQFGQVPCLTDGDFQLVQSGAIQRYLARKIGKGLYGANDKEAAHIDMCLDGVTDLRQKYATLIYRTEFSDSDKKTFMTETLPCELEKFEKLLKGKDNGSHFLNGSTICLADYALFEILDCVHVLCEKCLDKYPTLKAYHARVAERPNLKKYMDSDRRKGVKINGNGKQ